MGAHGAGATGLLPPRLQLHTHEVRTRVRVTLDRTRGFAVKVLPLNLGYDLRYGTTATQESRISICVARVPPRTAPPGAPD